VYALQRLGVRTRRIPDATLRALWHIGKGTGQWQPKSKSPIETKRDNLTLDEAKRSFVLGYRVTCDLLQAGSYIHYVFNGWRHEFSHNGQIGSSSAWTPDETHSTVAWRIFDLKPPTKGQMGKGCRMTSMGVASDVMAIVEAKKAEAAAERASFACLPGQPAQAVPQAIDRAYVEQSRAR
jgi:hypothetical protein